jgi:hypothetical protein
MENKQVYQNLLSEYGQFLEHNEFELALDMLEQLGDLVDCRGGFWRDLERAAENMELKDRIPELRKKFSETTSPMLATLSSNNGRSQFAIELGAPQEYACDPGFESSVTIRGQHWDGDHTFPLSTSIDGVWLRTADIVALRNHIARWLQQPLDRLVADDLNAEFELARLPGQSVLMRFGARDDTISDRHPVFSVSFSAGALHGEFHFVADQSCLALFAEGLSSVQI